MELLAQVGLLQYLLGLLLEKSYLLGDHGQLAAGVGTGELVGL